jgi:hypothetical protein
MAQVGEVWEEGRTSVAIEHMGTNYLRHRLLMWMVSGPPPRQVSPIVLSCAPDEWHEGDALPRGWQFILLGADTRRSALRSDGFPGLGVPLPDLGLPSCQAFHLVQPRRRRRTAQTALGETRQFTAAGGAAAVLRGFVFDAARLERTRRKPARRRPAILAVGRAFDHLTAAAPGAAVLCLTAEATAADRDAVLAAGAVGLIE